MTAATDPWCPCEWCPCCGEGPLLSAGLWCTAWSCVREDLAVRWTTTFPRGSTPWTETAPSASEGTHVQLRGHTYNWEDTRTIEGTHVQLRGHTYNWEDTRTIQRTHVQLRGHTYNWEAHVTTLWCIPHSEDYAVYSLSYYKVSSTGRSYTHTSALTHCTLHSTYVHNLAHMVNSNVAHVVNMVNVM